MIIMRVDNDRSCYREVKVLDIEIKGTNFRLTEQYGELLVHLRDGEPMLIHPCCSNEVRITAQKET